jgi:murein DD-endopeptidase MepM/ murein hydrolase activator NlpD
MKGLMDRKRTIQMIVIPDKGDKTYSVKIHRRLLYAIAIVLILMGALFLYMALSHRSLLSKAMRADRLERENAVLRTQALKIAKLEGELAQLASTRQHLYELAGLSAREDREEEKQDLSAEAFPLPVELSTITAGFELGDILPSDTEFDTVGALASALPAVWPVRGWITAEFNEELPGREEPHRGLDIAASRGTPILSAAEGLVTLSGWDTNLGLVVVIDHQNGLSTLYGHCSQVLVQAGDRVAQGEAIAHLGNTGRSSAPHLHFEVREGGIPVDPRAYLGP